MEKDAKFKHCGECSDKKKALCAKFGTCLAEGAKSKKGDKKPVRKGTHTDNSQPVTLL